MLTASALLEISHRIPSLDYNSLMKLAWVLTKDFSEVERMFRLMCFNVYAHNRDDHSNNFSFLYNAAEKTWTLAPAYDLTHSYSTGGEHATCVDGNGRNPGKKDILAVAEKIGLSAHKAVEISEEVADAVQADLHDLLAS